MTNGERPAKLSELLKKTTDTLEAFWISYRSRYEHSEDCHCKGCDETRALIAEARAAIPEER